MTRGRLMSGRFHQHGRATHGPGGGRAPNTAVHRRGCAAAPIRCLSSRGRKAAGDQTVFLAGSPPSRPDDLNHPPSKLWGTPPHGLKDRELPLAGVFYFYS